jgi:two-component system alkaline phosphatase synthesis response regulator PhoP
MKKTILIVDDEKDILQMLEYNLLKEGYNVLTASNGIEAIDKLIDKPNLIILDIMMPKMDGFEVCKQIRANDDFKYLPIIFLTAKDSEFDEVLGLELGADDFIPKPASPRKVVARIRSLFRRISENKKQTKTSFIDLNGLTIDTEKFLVKIRGDSIKLTKKEFDLLYILVSNPDKVYTREALLVNVWGDDVFVTDRVIDVHIRKLREKMGEFSEIIQTVRGRGYVFRLES